MRNGEEAGASASPTSSNSERRTFISDTSNPAEHGQRIRTREDKNFHV
jgi:hypothetical protein